MQSCNRFLLTSFNEPAREDRKVGRVGWGSGWGARRGAGEGGCEGIQFPDVGTLVGIAGVRGGLGYTCERGCACVCVNVCVRACVCTCTCCLAQEHVNKIAVFLWGKHLHFFTKIVTRKTNQLLKLFELQDLNFQTQIPDTSQTKRKQNNKIISSS